jgi:hypothetical protein
VYQKRNKQARGRKKKEKEEEKEEGRRIIHTKVFLLMPFYSQSKPLPNFVVFFVVLVLYHNSYNSI